MNATLQAGYFMLAARAMGLDVGPMAGFDRAKVDQEFFPDHRTSTIFLCNLGYGDPAETRQRDPRLDFAEACRFE
jgi:3-hydroxypropanoate dehydrogenase